LNNSVNGTITNNVNATAASGNATVSDNTSAGNATSGNATVASDIANIFASTLKIAHTFGILFINVFGSWTGSVGINTAAGNPAPSTSGGSGGLGGSLAATLGEAQGVATVSSGAGNGSNPTNSDSSSSGSIGSGAASLAGTALVAAAQSPSRAIKTAAKTTGLLLVLSAVTILLAAGSFGLERKLRR
jgi:hypothetical protein